MTEIVILIINMFDDMFDVKIYLHSPTLLSHFGPGITEIGVIYLHADITTPISAVTMIHKGIKNGGIER